MKPAIVLPILFFLLPRLAAGASTGFITGEVWIREAPLDIENFEAATAKKTSLTDAERERFNQLLDDIRWILSGMIYGFNVTWTPSFSSREISETLNLTPIGLIPPIPPSSLLPDDSTYQNNGQMRVESWFRENKFVYLRLRYDTDETQRRRLEGWKSQAYKRIRGYGKVQHVLVKKRATIISAVREALRGYLRKRVFNRPRVIQAQMSFEDFPILQPIGGGLSATVKIRVKILQVRPYTID